MRTHSARVTARDFVTSFLAITCFALGACGGDDDSAQSALAQAGSGPAALADRTAGKACSADKDCGAGRCLKQFESAGLLGTTRLDAPGGYCSLDCRVSADCGQGGECLGAVGGAAGQCLASCKAGSDCRDGYYCTDYLGQPVAGSTAGTCQVAPATDKLTGTTVGSMCSANEDCGGGRCQVMDLLRVAYPGGYCTGRCLTHADCGEQGWCSGAIGGATGSCYRSCSADADCDREGYRCRAALGSTDKRCVPGSEPLPDDTVGKACTQDGDCGGKESSCASQLTTAMAGDVPLPGGYCTASCIEDIDCGRGGSCIGQLRAYTQGLASGCYKTCTGPADCRDGYRCLAPRNMAGMTGMQPSVCAPMVAMSGADAGL